MNKKRSDIWNLFDVVDGNIAKCTFCSGTFSYKGGATPNLTRHLKRKHPTALVSVGPSTSMASTSKAAAETESGNSILHPTSLDAQSNRNTTSSNKTVTISKRKYQSTLTSFTNRPLPLQSSKKLDEQLTIMIAAEYQPFSLVEDTQFRIFVNMLNPNYSLPSRKTVSNVLLPQLYNKIREAVEDRLSTADSIAFTTDGWTSINNDSYQSLTAHFINSDGKLVSFVLGCFKTEETHTALNLAAAIKKMLTDWKIFDKMCGVVTDNAANIKAAIRNISSTWCHTACFAHTLNLIVQNGLREMKVSRNKAKSVVEFFKRSPVAAAKLQSLQKQMEYPELKLKNDVVTRWNSTYDMLDRITKVKDPLLSAIAVTNCAETLTAHDFDIFAKCCKILKPFKDVTEELSSEKGVTISKVILFSRLLLNNISKIRLDLERENLNPSETEIFNMCETLAQGLQKRFQDAEDNIIWADSTFLDPRFKKYGFKKDTAYKSARDRIVNKITAAISLKQAENHEQIQPNTPPSNQKSDDLWSDFDSQIHEIQIDNSPHTAAITEVDKFLEEPILRRDCDPLKWWEERKFAFPNMYVYMKSRLSIPATSVPSERIFSKTGQIVNDRRSRLSADKVEKTVFISSNLHVLC